MNTSNWSSSCLILNKIDIERRLSVANIKHDRFVLKELKDYCNNPCKVVMGVYGLRRTGKSIMLYTAALEMLNQGKTVVFIELTPNTCPNDLMTTLDSLVTDSTSYIFIDEITFADDFTSWGVNLYNLYASIGIHTIISGTYSYALKLASTEVLFDRMKLLHTTVITFSEYTYLTDNSLITYIKTGGIFTNISDVWSDYLDTAIITNIIKSMKRLDSSKYKAIANIQKDKLRPLLFFILQEIYLRPILEDLTLKYEYPDLYQSLRNLAGRGQMFDGMEIHKTELTIKTKLRVSDLFIDNTKTMVFLLRDILLEMDVLDYIDIITVTDTDILKSREFFITQPGLMYYQALVSKDSVLKNISNNRELTKNIINVVEGRILENIVFRDTKKKYINYDIFQLRADKFEIDMVMSDSYNNISLYEIKHSTKAINPLTKHLTDERLDIFLERIFGNYILKDKFVLYTGTTTVSENNTCFKNVERFLLT